MFPPLWLVRFRQWRHRRVDRLADPCWWCGYDLRGTLESCPECGAWTGRSAFADRGRLKIESRPSDEEPKPQPEFKSSTRRLAEFMQAVKRREREDHQRGTDRGMSS